MIELLATALLTCISLAQADAFGSIRFAENVAAGDTRFASVACNEDGCTGRDHSGVEYQTNGEWVLQKVIAGRGPSEALLEELHPEPDAETETLTAALCLEASWISLIRQPDGSYTYGLYAQP